MSGSSGMESKTSLRRWRSGKWSRAMHRSRGTGTWCFGQICFYVALGERRDQPVRVAALVHKD